MKMSECCGEPYGRPTRLHEWGECYECGRQGPLVRADYYSPARPTREDDIDPPRSACCNAPIESGDSAHWCSADGCGRQARPGGDGYNVRGDTFLGTSEAAERELDRLMARRYKQEEERLLTDNPGPCERIGRYLDGAIETIREPLRLLIKEL